MAFYKLYKRKKKLGKGAAWQRYRSHSAKTKKKEIKSPVLIIKRHLVSACFCPVKCRGRLVLRFYCLFDCLLLKDRDIVSIIDQVLLPVFNCSEVIVLRCYGD